MAQDFSDTASDTNAQLPDLLRLFCAINKIDGAYYFCARKMKLKENTLALLYALDDGLPHSQKQVCEDWLNPENDDQHRYPRAGGAGLCHPRFHRASPGKNIILTEEGRRYAAKVMGEMKLAEREALSETLKHFSPEFIDAFDFFSQSLCRSLEEHGLK